MRARTRAGARPPLKPACGTITLNELDLQLDNRDFAAVRIAEFAG